MRFSISISLIVFLLAGCGNSESRMAKRADKIHSCIFTIDTHCDTPMEFADGDFDLGKIHEEGCVDIPRMIQGGLNAEFFAVFIAQGPRNDSTYDKVHYEALEIIEAIHSNILKNSDSAGIATSSEDGYRLKKEGKIAAYMGLENGYPVGSDISRIREYYGKGIRYITLAHTQNNDICDSSTDPDGPEHNGLSAFGAEVVKEMNNIGMIVDISHVSDKSFYDVLKVTRAPVIASHSSCRALCGSPRNISDDMLLALKENGGVIQICMLGSYLRSPEPNPEMEARLADLRSRYGKYSTLPKEKKKLARREYREIKEKYERKANVSDVVDHIDHVVQVIGIDHVGIGSDFDGGGGVEDCKSVAEMKNITIELLRRGYTKADIRKIWGGNFMRVFKRVEETAELSLNKSGV